MDDLIRRLAAIRGAATRRVGEAAGERVTQTARQGPPPRPPVAGVADRFGHHHDLPVPLSGTTTTCRTAAVDVLARREAPLPAVHELTGILKRELDSPVDPYAVAVLVDGQRVGYLPLYAALTAAVGTGVSVEVPVQLFGALVESGVRVKGGVWLAHGVPRWLHGPTSWPPMSEAAEAREQARRRSLFTEGRSSTCAHAEAVWQPRTPVEHPLESAESIEQLMREGQWEEALGLCYVAIETAEAQSGVPSPAYTFDAAVALRRLGRREAEIEVLIRFLSRVPDGKAAMHPLAVRLDELLRD